LCSFIFRKEAKYLLPLEEIKNGSKVIGTKQVKKAIARDSVKKVYVAGDAEPHVIEPIKELCAAHKVEVEIVEKMETLGKACGIEVGSAAVALLNDNQ
jgi:large subunit ribosomal protein L7A